MKAITIVMSALCAGYTGYLFSQEQLGYAVVFVGLTVYWGWRSGQELKK